MELKLTNPEEIGDYFEYLFDNNLTSTYYPEVIVPETELFSFLQYINKPNLDTTAKSDSNGRCLTTAVQSTTPSSTLVSKTKWSDKEKSYLQTLIAVGYSLSDIASELNRSKDAVRTMAYTFSFRYSNKTKSWTYYQPTKE